MRCREVRNKLDLFVMQELTTAEFARIEAHLEGCGACREALAKARRLEELLLAAPVPPIPEEFAGQVLARARMQRSRAARPKPRWRFEHPVWKKAVGSMATAAALAAGILLGIAMGDQTWRSGRSEAAHQPGDLLAVSNLESLVEPGGDSLAEAYLSLTTAGDR